MEPLISIVTPSYNQAQFLEQTIRSVLEQNFSGLEYMVVDGGSADGSVDIIRKYAADLSWWVSEPDQGQGDAIRKCLARAGGKYIAWINSDDYYLPGAIEQAVAALESKPDWGLVYGNVLAVNETGEKINLLEYQPYQLEDLMQFQIIGQPAVFMRREVYEQAGGISGSYHYLLDHHLWLRMAALAPMAYIPQTWAAARFHQAAKNTAMAAQFASEAQQIAAWMEQEAPFKQRMAALTDKAWAGAYRFGARYLSEGRQYSEALKMYHSAWQKNPQIVLRDWKRVGVTVLGRLGLWKRPVEAQ